MATVSTLPAVVLPDKPMQFVFAATAGGNYVKVWCTSAPRGSKLREALDAGQAARVSVIGESDIGQRPQYTFDAGGAYVLEIEEIQKGAESYGGRYRGDPDGFRTEDRVSAEPATVHVASLMEFKLGLQPDTATLQLYVVDDATVATNIATHGFASPAIVNASTDKARAAADTADVLTALAALSGIDVDDLLGDPAAAVTDFIDKFTGHQEDTETITPSHSVTDFDNAISEAFAAPSSPKALQQSLARCFKNFNNHITNVDPTDTTPDPGSADYHNPGSVNSPDWANVATAPGGQTMDALLHQFADLHRCFEAHRVSDVHVLPDTVHALDALPPLGALVSAFLTHTSALSPAVPSNQNSGAVRLVSGAGFKEA